MSVTCAYRIDCDYRGGDCPQRVEVRTWSSTDARKYVATRRGWLCDESGDWCPAHRPARQENPATTPQ